MKTCKNNKMNAKAFLLFVDLTGEMSNLIFENLMKIYRVSVKLFLQIFNSDSATIIPRQLFVSDMKAGIPILDSPMRFLSNSYWQSYTLLQRNILVLQGSYLP